MDADKRKLEARKAGNPMAAVTYACISIVLVLVNKAVLSTFKFPHYRTLTAAQSLATLFFMLIFRKLGLITFRGFRFDIARKVAPMSLLFVSYVIISLSALGNVNMPMFTALRRTTVAFVLLGEFVILHKVPHFKVQIATGIMVAGAVIAALNDLTFDLVSYSLVLGTNMSSALYSVLVARVRKQTNMTVLSLLYYNTVITLPFLVVYVVFSGELNEVMNFPYIATPAFQVAFLLSASLAFLLNWASFRNTTVNSPMTQTVTGQIKNFIAFLLSLLLFADYKYSFYNMAGLVFGFTGGVLYGFVKLQQQLARNQAARDEEAAVDAAAAAASEKSGSQTSKTTSTSNSTANPRNSGAQIV